MTKMRITVTLLTCFAFLSLAIAPEFAHAAFTDESGNLPGTESNGAITTAAIVGGVVIVGVIAFLLIKKHKQSAPTPAADANDQKWSRLSSRTISDESTASSSNSSSGLFSIASW